MASPQKHGSRPEKTMSSRLLTMKFMQRAAATAASKEPQSADDSDPHTPKRQRLSAEAESHSPGAGPANLETISAAVAAEEDKRREAISRQAAEAGETEWVLDYSGGFGQYAPQPNVVAADSLDAEDEVDGGRKSFGNFRRKKTGATDWTDDSVEEKPKERKTGKSVNLGKLKSISGGGQDDSDDEKQKRRKRKQK